MKIPQLVIDDLEIKYPIIQGGMGVRVSKANLASAVAREGGVGTIASVCIGPIEGNLKSEFAKLNKKALIKEVEKAKSMANGGVIAVNIMVALTDYETLVQGAIEGGADIIVSGAGLPLMLPEYAKGSKIKLVPIVSSARATKIICEKWLRRFSRLPDAFVFEGILAGGHLGFSFDDIEHMDDFPLDKILVEIIDVVKEYEKKYNKKIPVIAAGGIFDGKDIARVLNLGAAGVQMSTRFVCTFECDVSPKFKQAYIDSKKEDIVIIRSPVQMPGRVIRNTFVKEVVEKNKKVHFECPYHCLKTCVPKETPYCIARVLLNAAEGRLDEGFVFVGQNAYKCDKIITVKELMTELVSETEKYLSS